VSHAGLDELREWDDRIVELVDAFGLECYAQEFEICDHNDMLGYMAYSGMPSQYPHWSFGKSFEKQKTLYDHGVSGLPYEMVINSDPSLAYLMRDNSLGLNILTMAHVYGHNDFFRNNSTFGDTEPQHTVARFKSHAERIRSYVEDPAAGPTAVEATLDAAHALAFNCRRNMSIRKTTRSEQLQRAIDIATPPADRNASIHAPRCKEDPDLSRIPLEPEPDLLLFIRDYNPYLAEWQKDILTIVHEQAHYFIPQMETKIMNEGWASYWHYQIMSELGLPEDLRLEFMINHNQVIRPHPGGINPYHVGFRIWQAIYEREEGDGPIDHRRRNAGHQSLFTARETDRDSSFLRRFLDRDLVRDLGLFEFAEKGRDTVVTRVADEQGWESVRDSLVASVGTGSLPVIEITDADFQGSRQLQLVHRYQGQELELPHARATMELLRTLWGRDVLLDTVLNQKPARLHCSEDGFSAEST